MTKITRVEIIDETGRIFSRWNQHVDISMQDNARTMKIFIEHNPNGTATGEIDMQPIIDMLMNDYEDKLVGDK